LVVGETEFSYGSQPPATAPQLPTPNYQLPIPNYQFATMPQYSIGVIGLGIMGSAMAENLLRAGYRVVGYDILAKRRQVLSRAGGHAVAGCANVGEQADVVICSLPSSEALLQTATDLVFVTGSLTRDSRRARSTSRAPIVIETSTLPIEIKERARKTFAKRGAVLLDCPLSGTGAQARKKDLVVYASGERAAYRRVIPVLEAFARAHYHLGSFGAGSKMKFVANLLVAIHNVAAAEALVLAKNAGLDPPTTLKVIADGAGSSRMLQMRGPMMVKGDYRHPTMKLEVWKKDMEIIGEFARSVGSPTPLFGTSAPVYEAALAMGREKEDTAAVHAVLELMTRERETSSKFKVKSSKSKLEVKSRK
jgi:L-threonate 2-dehydrogenase